MLLDAYLFITVPLILFILLASAENFYDGVSTWLVLLAFATLYQPTKNDKQSSQSPGLKV